MKTPEEKELLKSIGERLRAFRTEHGFSQETLSFDADLPKNQIGRIERGEIATTVITLSKICKALGVSIKELF